MSLILDAINRADQERNQQNSTPNINSGYSPAVEAKRPIGRWLIEGAVILLIVTGITYSRFFQTQQAAIIDTAEQTIVPDNPAPVNRSEQALPAVAPPPLATEPNPSGEAVISKKQIKSATSNTVLSLYQQSTPDSLVKPSNDKVTANKNTSSQAVVNNSQLILQQIPILAQMPQRFQNTIPSIDYSVHVYANSQKAGFVTLNGATRKIGDQIYPGLRVIAILKNSVVLDYNNTQFRLLALNSWVNFN